MRAFDHLAQINVLTLRNLQLEKQMKSYQGGTGSGSGDNNSVNINITNTIGMFCGVPCCGGTPSRNTRAAAHLAYLWNVGLEKYIGLI